MAAQAAPQYLLRQINILKLKLDSLTKILDLNIKNESPGNLMSTMEKFFRTEAYREIIRKKLQDATKLNNDLLREAEYWRNKWVDFYIDVSYASKAGITREKNAPLLQEKKDEMRDFVKPIGATERISEFEMKRREAQNKINEKLIEKISSNLIAVDPGGYSTVDKEYIKYIAKTIVVDIKEWEDNRLHEYLMDPNFVGYDEMEVEGLIKTLEKWLTDTDEGTKAAAQQAAQLAAQGQS